MKLLNTGIQTQDWRRFEGRKIEDLVLLFITKLRQFIYFSFMNENEALENENRLSPLFRIFHENQKSERLPYTAYKGFIKFRLLEWKFQVQ